MEWLENIVQSSNIPLLTALALGLLTAIAPCPLATNITATAYIAKTINSKKTVLMSGLFYTLGRVISYTFIAGIIYWGASKFQTAKLFQSNGEKYIGFVLMLLGLIMLDIIKLNFIKSGKLTNTLSEKFKDQGLLGAFLLGTLFALAFCPYSGALFFGMLIPLTMKSGMYIPIVFSLGTGLPVILFAFIIAFSLDKLGSYFKAITQLEKTMRFCTGLTFVLTGLYYINLFFNLI